MSKPRESISGGYAKEVRVTTWQEFRLVSCDLKGEVGESDFTAASMHCLFRRGDFFWRIKK
jgi:hypothetical protein